VAVEKLLCPKFTKIKLRQDALQTTFLIFETFCIPPISAVWEETRLFQQPLVGVEKLSDRTELVRAGVVLRVVFLLSGDSWWFCWLAEEAHESLDVLGHRCQEELLSNELHAP
jgi:hypothetical protein